MKTGLLRRLARRRRDPLAAREARLEAELAAVQEEIRALKARRARGEARGGGAVRGVWGGRPAASGPVASAAEPIRDQSRDAYAGGWGESTGWRATDHGAGRRRRRRGAKPEPPRWAPYLAAGSIQGLPARRHEKRVARNRFLLWLAAGIVGGLGLLYWWHRVS
ncbi:MAG: hypothetical protein D6766_04610 [Verrucomicrobia bacterium]|nr:MAG: hypothetical protein D6766_04610 [Verrucomicrobiota bacterium]